MADVDRSKEYLKALKDADVVAVGKQGASSVDIAGLPDGTAAKAGEYKVAFDTTDDKALSPQASDTADVPAFTTPTPTVAVTGVAFDSETGTVAVGKTTKPTYKISPDNATNKAVKFSSSAEDVATVGSDGTVTGVKAGKATITVTTTDGNKTSTTEITVTA